MRLKDRAKELLQDRFILISFLLDLVLIATHAYNLTDHFTVEAVGRLIFCAIYPLGVFLWKREYMFIAFPAFGLFLQHFNTLNNYTTFLIIMITACYKPRRKYPMLFIYALNFIAVIITQHKLGTHAQIHALNCAMIYCAFEFLLIHSRKRRLDLTDDERKILEEMKAGAQQKEVKCFSKNTVTKKLKEACTRNGCISTSELVYIYRHLS